jgi:hypothetical protein
LTLRLNVRNHTLHISHIQFSLCFSCILFHNKQKTLHIQEFFESVKMKNIYINY